MTLASQSKTMSLFILLVSIISAYLYIQLINSVELKRQGYDRLSKISQGVFELNLLTSEHLSLRTKRSEVQWNKRHASLTNHMLAASREFGVESNKFILRARVGLASVRRLFFKILIAEHKLHNTDSKEVKKHEKLINRLAVQVRLISQQVVSDVNRAGRLSIENLKKSEELANTTLAAILITILLMLISIMFWIQRFFIAPITELNKFSETLIKGDYHNRTIINSNNEIGDLAESFNSLAITIASKIDDLVEKSANIEESKNNVEEALEKTKSTERQYKDIFYSAADAIFTINVAGTILTTNPASQNLFGYTAKELIGHNIKMIVSPEHYHNHDTYIKNYTDTRIKKVIGKGLQVNGKHKNGRLIPVFLRITNINRNGKDEFIGVVRDMTEEIKAKQEAVKANELLEITNKELESYAYSISHDLRSPLRSIDGFSLVLLEDYGDSLNDEAKDYLLRIRNGSKKMSELITELLNISRIMKEAMKLEQVDLSAIATAEIKQIKQHYPDNTIEFSCDEKIIANADKPLIQSVMENLINNAVKYSHKNKLIKIQFSCFKQDNKTIYFIKDNGSGFDMKHKNKLFKPFQRLHKVNQFEGSGIGLATVQRIISRHNGEIWAEAEIDKGATFFFSLN